MPQILLRLKNHFAKHTPERHIYGQLFRAGSSSGANCEESVGAESKADFIHKTQVVLKEVRESNYWLRLIRKADLIDKDNSELKFLLEESFEFIKIFSSSIVTAKRNLSTNKPGKQ